MTTASTYDGLSGRVVAKVMARSNRDAEREAIEVLDPSAGDAVLAIGAGPGVGVELLAARMGRGRVVAVDPSEVMLAETRRRNRRWIETGLVQLMESTAHRLPSPDASFDGAIAVNSIQLWKRLDLSIAEVARTLRPSGRLVALTHDWAIQRSTGRVVDDWFRWICHICADHGLASARTWRAQAEHGRSVAFTAVKTPHV
jgi:ubiquinone/menaquinone biosynthesis C-methylase UbiE